MEDAARVRDLAPRENNGLHCSLTVQPDRLTASRSIGPESRARTERGTVTSVASTKRPLTGGRSRGSFVSHMLAVGSTENHSSGANVRAAGVVLVVGIALGLLIGPGAAAD